MHVNIASGGQATLVRRCEREAAVIGTTVHSDRTKARMLLHRPDHFYDNVQHLVTRGPKLPPQANPPFYFVICVVRPCPSLPPRLLHFQCSQRVFQRRV
jgi:hypothetical protein